LRKFCFFTAFSDALPIYIFSPLQDSETPVSPSQPQTLVNMSTQVYEIAQHYKLRECLGLGVGNGGYILTHCAADHPHLFAGLVLISPSSQPAGWWEWGMGRVALTTLRTWGWATTARDYFSKRLFSPATLQILGGDSDLLRAFHRDIQTLSPVAVAGYLAAVLYRPSLIPFVKKVKCRVLLVYGAEGIYENDCMEISNAIDKTRFALLEVQHAGVLVNEEKPTEMLSSLQLFLTALQLEGIGLGAGGEVGS
jgi:pimeloyl-ACP methyl ester carboxylesterase